MNERLEDQEHELTHDEWEHVFTLEQAVGTNKRGRHNATPAEDEAPAETDEKKLRYKKAGTATRRGNTIRAYIGANGGGKTLAAVHDVIPSLKAGRRVLSTVKLLDPWTGNVHPNYVRLTDWPQVLEARGTDLVLDEIIGIASSRASQGMPQAVANILNQLRRADNTLSWTAPAWSRSDVVIREVTQGVTVCRGMLSKTYVAPPGEPERQWTTKRLFRWITYDAVDFSTWTDSKEGKLDRDGAAWFWGPDSEAFASYDTFDSVDRVGEVLDSGRCAWCGGTRTAHKCACEPGAHSHTKLSK